MSARALCVVAFGALIAGVLFRRTLPASPPPHVLREPIRLARNARLLTAVHECPGTDCIIDVEREMQEQPPGGGERRRRRRWRRGRGRHRGRFYGNASGDAVGKAVRGTAAFGDLKPLTPLPSAYALHLAYMEAHPTNRPDATSSGVRDAWGVAIVAHGNKVDTRGGVSQRDAELLAIQRQSGWDILDSPAVALPAPLGDSSRASARPPAPVLTGSAWHWGRGRCPAECAANEGVCLPDLGR